MASGQKKSVRAPERSYAHRPLLDKLGVKPESRIALLDIRDDSFLTQLRRRVIDISAHRPKKDSDLIFLAAETKAALERLSLLRPFLKPNGAIWVVYPKGVQHIREIDVIGLAKAARLVDVKVVSFSATHTALKLVIPLAHR